MIDFIIRDCGYGEFLSIIQVTDSGKELYRGSRVKGREAAFVNAKTAWDEGQSGNIVEFKQEKGL
jgi:hypothetical protein